MTKIVGFLLFGSCNLRFHFHRYVRAKFFFVPSQQKSSTRTGRLFTGHQRQSSGLHGYAVLFTQSLHLTTSTLSLLVFSAYSSTISYILSAIGFSPISGISSRSLYKSSESLSRSGIVFLLVSLYSVKFWSAATTHNIQSLSVLRRRHYMQIVPH